MKTFEGFLDLFKKSKQIEPEEEEGEWNFEHVNMQPHMMEYFNQFDPEKREAAIDDNRNWAKGLTEYVKKNLINKKIRLKCVEEYALKLPSNIDYKYHEFVVKNCSIWYKNLLKIRDTQNNDYVVGHTDIYQDLSVWKKVNRKITPEDPYGEEEWVD